MLNNIYRIFFIACVSLRVPLILSSKCYRAWLPISTRFNQR